MGIAAGGYSKSLISSFLPSRRVATCLLRTLVENNHGGTCLKREENASSCGRVSDTGHVYTSLLSCSYDYWCSLWGKLSVSCHRCSGFRGAVAMIPSESLLCSLCHSRFLKPTHLARSCAVFSPWKYRALISCPPMPRFRQLDWGTWFRHQNCFKKEFPLQSVGRIGSHHWGIQSIEGRHHPLPTGCRGTPSGVRR